MRTLNPCPRLLTPALSIHFPLWLTPLRWSHILQVKGKAEKTSAWAMGMNQNSPGPTRMYGHPLSTSIPSHLPHTQCFQPVADFWGANWLKSYCQKFFHFKKSCKETDSIKWIINSRILSNQVSDNGNYFKATLFSWHPSNYNSHRRVGQLVVVGYIGILIESQVNTELMRQK